MRPVVSALLLGLAATGCSSPPPAIEEFGGAELGILDTYVRSSVPDARWGTEPGLIVGGWGDTYQALIRIDVTELPDIAADEQVLLLLYNTSTHPEQQPTDVQLSVLTSAFADDINWHGAQMVTSRPVAVMRAGGYNAWTEIDISDVVRAWQGGATNFGLQLAPVQTDNRFNVFLSSDSPDTAHRPRLRIIRPPQ